MTNKKLLWVSISVVAILVTGAFAISSFGLFNEYSSTDTAGLPDATLSEIVELKDGDAYDLVADYVKKNIGGTEYRMLAYNGSIPGPLLKIPQGAEVTIRFTNATDMKTLLHPHGVRADNRFDGAQTVQSEMKPGETFAYTLRFPDAGVFWYHPHVREDFQQELGLYGNFLVVPSDRSYWNPVNREVALFLDDILIDGGGIPLSKRGADRTLMGRFGNVMLVNGERGYVLNAKRGETVRLYLTNAANARPMNVAIPGVRVKLVGGDGGAYEREQWVDSVILAPSERAIVEVLFDKSGTFAIENRTPARAYALGSVVVSEEPVDVSYAAEFRNLATHRAIVESIDPFRALFDTIPAKRVALTVDMSGNMADMPGMGHGGHVMPDGTVMRGTMEQGSSAIEWDDTNPMMNFMSDAGSVAWNIVDRDTGMENMGIDWTFAKGEPVKISIYNDSDSMHPMSHPIHFHGQRFLIVDRNGIRERDLVWKDTVFVPSGETVDILLDTSNPGTWMAHCHIAEHLEAGMMLSFTVR